VQRHTCTDTATHARRACHRDGSRSCHTRACTRRTHRCGASDRLMQTTAHAPTILMMMALLTSAHASRRSRYADPSALSTH
jgi:hypothetical protein